MSKIYYPEEVLIGKLQSGEFTHKDYVLHYSPQWERQYNEFCEERGLEQNDDSAKAFLDFKEDELMDAIVRGEI